MCLPMCALPLTLVLLPCLFPESVRLIGSAFGHGDPGTDGKSPAVMKAPIDMDIMLDMEKPAVEQKEDRVRMLLKLLKRLKDLDGLMRVLFQVVVAVFIGIMFGIREGSYQNTLVPD